MKTKEEILKDLSGIKPELINEYGVSKLGLFGSYARGEQKEDSDIDILIEISKPEYSVFMGVLIKLEKLFGQKVDLIRIHKNMRKSFVARIINEVIYV